MSVNSRRQLKKTISRSFLAKDRDAFLAEFLRHAQTFFPDRIKDFSENSVGGLFADFASFVGDTMSFYLDHQFHELNPETAIETKNIQRHLKSAGVKITGNSPAVVNVSFRIIISAEKVGTKFQPQTSALPIILQGTQVQSNNGTIFELVEDLDYSEKDTAGNFKAEIRTRDVNSDGSPIDFFVSLNGLCVSGFRTTESFSIENLHVPFRKITLSNEHITEVIRVTDANGNEYYEVEALSQDTVFKRITNTSTDNDLVDDNLEVIFAPHRFTRQMDFDTKLTTLQFGAGKVSAIDDDIVPDPSEFAIPLFGKKTFSQFTLDPSNLLDTRTLGIAPINTTISVEYRYGGGLSHNVATNGIRTLNSLSIRFPGNPSVSTAATLRATIDVNNNEQASGGENAQTLTELKNKISSFRNAQNRIVSKEDLLARVYTMPSNFGRVFRASVRANPDNPLASQLFIISRDVKNRLIVSPDTLKRNLSKFLNSFRLISDSIDILDAQVINIGIDYKISTELSANANLVIQNVNKKLKEYFHVKNWQIGQGINLTDVQNLIYNTDGVASVLDIRVRNLVGKILDREYSENKINIQPNIRNGVLVVDPSVILEVRYPDFDLKGSSL